MGIHKLFQFLESKAPNSFREIRLDVYTSKSVACDASKVGLVDYLSVRSIYDKLR